MQVAMIPIGDKGIHIDSLKMNLNAYTAPGFLGFIMTLVNIIAVLTWFREFEIDIYEGKRPPEVQTGSCLLLVYYLKNPTRCLTCDSGL